jgi:hypothetical protein
MSASITGWVIDGTLSQTDLQAIGCQNLPPFDGTGSVLPTFTPTFTPTTTPLPPMLENIVISFDATAAYEGITNVSNCAIASNEIHCLVHFSVVELVQALPAGTDLSHGIMIEIIVYSEYLTTLSDSSNLFNWHTEAIARRLYVECGYDGCNNNSELYDFLEYYSPAKNQIMDEIYDLIEDIDTNTKERLENTSDLIVNLPPTSWISFTGSYVDNKPYGFGYSSCVADEDLAQYQACGIAEIAINNTSTDPNAPNGVIRFGTTFESHPLISCKFKIC